MLTDLFRPVSEMRFDQLGFDLIMKADSPMIESVSSQAYFNGIDRLTAIVQIDTPADVSFPSFD